MKILSSLTLLLSFFTFVTAQVPESAEDISPLLISESLPKAELTLPNGKKTMLKDVIKEKPTVLVFYRGGWCPYCNGQLTGLMDIEQDILDLGYKIVAISPDNYKDIQMTKEDREIKYELYSDDSGSLIKNIGIAFKTPKKYDNFIFKSIVSKKVSKVLPVPTVMIVDKKGTILFEYISPNYKQRITGDLLLAVLKNLDV